MKSKLGLLSSKKIIKITDNFENTLQPKVSEA